jgi:signal transduction histidine kinase
MRRRLIAGAAYLMLVVIVGLTVPFAAALGTRLTDELGARVEREAFAVASIVEDRLERGQAAGFQTLIERLATRIGGRVIVTDHHGVLLADSLQPPGLPPPNYSSRPEIASALAGQPTWLVRSSQSLGYDLMVSAVPVRSAGRIFGAVRISFPMSAVNAAIHRSWWFLAAVGVVTFVVGLILAAWLARWVTRPLRVAASVARQIEGGDLEARVPAGGPPEVRELAHDLNAMTDRLSDLLRANREFAANASHQLRTPLTALRLSLEEIRDGTDPHGEVEHAIEQADRLRDVVSALLELGASRERGSDVVDVGAVARELRRDGEPRVEVRGDGSVVGDDSRVRQVIGNVVDNARRHATSLVEVTIEARGDRIVVVVDDDGAGVPEDDRARVFDRFARGTQPRGTGSGLGLSVARELAAADGGTVEVTDGPLGGARFEIAYRAAEEPVTVPAP